MQKIIDSVEVTAKELRGGKQMPMDAKARRMAESQTGEDLTGPDAKGQ
jgi:hypothetical protein